MSHSTRKTCFSQEKEGLFWGAAKRPLLPWPHAVHILHFNHSVWANPRTNVDSVQNCCELPWAARKTGLAIGKRYVLGAGLRFSLRTLLDHIFLVAQNVQISKGCSDDSEHLILENDAPAHTHKCRLSSNGSNGMVQWLNAS